MGNLRNIWKFSWKNDGFRSLLESIVYPEVEQALSDWKNHCDSEYVLIGGLAYSFYGKPRQTQDIDLMFLSFDNIPDYVYGFKRNRNHSFQHNKTHVEVEVLDPEYLKMSNDLIKVIFDEAIESDGIKIASPKSLIVLKLDRYNTRDQSDIDDLLKYCIRLNIDLDFDKYKLNDGQLLKLKRSLDNLELNESKDVNSFVLEVNYLLENNTFQEIENNTGYKIYIINDKYSEPCFYYLNKVNRVMRFGDFNFCIKIPSNIDEKLEVIASSSDFKSFVGYDKEKELLIKWLKNVDNIHQLKENWKKIN